MMVTGQEFHRWWRKHVWVLGILKSASFFGNQKAWWDWDEMDEHLEWKQRAEQLQHDFASPTAVTKDMIKYTHDRLFFAFLGCAILCALAPVQLGFRVLVMSGMVFPTKKNRVCYNGFATLKKTPWMVTSRGKGFVLIAVAFKAWCLSCKGGLHVVFYSTGATWLVNQDFEMWMHKHNKDQ